MCLVEWLVPFPCSVIVSLSSFISFSRPRSLKNVLRTLHQREKKMVANKSVARGCETTTTFTCVRASVYAYIQFRKVGLVGVIGSVYRSTTYFFFYIRFGHPSSRYISDKI